MAEIAAQALDEVQTCMRLSVSLSIDDVACTVADMMRTGAKPADCGRYAELLKCPKNSGSFERMNYLNWLRISGHSVSYMHVAKAREQVDGAISRNVECMAGGITTPGLFRKCIVSNSGIWVKRMQAQPLSTRLHSNCLRQRGENPTSSSTRIWACLSSARAMHNS